MFKLHDYQRELVERTRKAYADGFKAPCIVSPCGSGKSVMISEIARMTTLKGNRVLFLVHRKELIEQIQNTFRLNEVNMDLVHFGMVQTVVRKLDRLERPELIITDESHHGLANTYRKIYDYYSDILRLSFTATPIRLNGDGLGAVNDILIEGVSVKYLIENHFLSPFKYYAPKLINENALKVNRMHEFSNSSICESLNNVIYGDVVGHYQKLAPGEQAILYAHSIETSKHMKDVFLQHGISAEHIDGKTAKHERENIIDRFRSGKIKILCNVDLIGEGFDVPDCSTVILLRPTQSLSLFIQQSMRGMRYKPGKTSIIIDHVNNVGRFGLPDMERKWTLDAKRKRGQEATIKVKQCNNCFAVFSANKNKCPECGFVPKVENDQSFIIDGSIELQEVDQSFVLDYSKPSDCKNYSELKEMAKRKGYKPGWAYIQGKRMGFIK